MAREIKITKDGLTITLIASVEKSKGIKPVEFLNNGGGDSITSTNDLVDNINYQGTLLSNTKTKNDYLTFEDSDRFTFLAQAVSDITFRCVDFIYDANHKDIIIVPELERYLVPGLEIRDIPIDGYYINVGKQLLNPVPVFKAKSHIIQVPGYGERSPAGYLETMHGDLNFGSNNNIPTQYVSLGKFEDIFPDTTISTEVLITGFNDTKIVPLTGRKPFDFIVPLKF